MVLIRFIYPKRNGWYNEGFRRKTFIVLLVHKIKNKKGQS
jgi:hypothetical protein